MVNLVRVDPVKLREILNKAFDQGRQLADQKSAIDLLFDELKPIPDIWYKVPERSLSPDAWKYPGDG